MTTANDAPPPKPMIPCPKGIHQDFPFGAGECPYCLPDEEVQAPDEKGRPRFPQSVEG